MATYEAHVHIPADEVVAELLPAVERRLAEVEANARRTAEQTVRDREDDISRDATRQVVESIARDIEHGYGLTGELDKIQLTAAECRRIALCYLPAEDGGSP